MIAFALDAGHDTRNAFVNSLRLITSAVSLGHDETLIVHEDAPAARAAMFPEVFRTHGLLRLAVGLEDPDDLIADLAAALDPAGCPRPDTAVGPHAQTREALPDVGRGAGSRVDKRAQWPVYGASLVG
ncbi:PLP-dependent transferase [Streptomyces sp. CA-210063]|uniref:PLP-dependent transferase n=1 Tax=Streptomyces sp. CA-210063 TaxID=2801029 RepID=UPI003FA7CFF7